VVFPQAASPDGWDALLADDAALSAGVATIAQRHGLAGAAVRRYDSGSVPVYALGERHVLKLFAPNQDAFAQVEAKVLAFLAGALPVATPELIAVEVIDGWHALLMTQLRGQRLVDAWPLLSSAEQTRLADDLGRSLAVLHALDAAALAPIEPEWDQFIAAQTVTAVERQRRRGLAAHWLKQIPAFLGTWKPATGAARRLLHTEVMREHLLVQAGSEGWRLSGVFDFEPAMLGDPAYEFASAGLFVACGDARMLRRILLAYGYADASLTPALACRFMAHALLHRYSNLRWYLERLPPQGAITLEQLALHWWPMLR
jgi:hygromycin-B 7''-O-kinase